MARGRGAFLGCVRSLRGAEVSHTLTCDICGEPIVTRDRPMANRHTHCSASVNSVEIDVCAACRDRIAVDITAIEKVDQAPQLCQFARSLLVLPL